MPTTKWKSQTALFLSSQGLSLLGSMVVQYALMWHLTMQTQSGQVMTLAVLVGFVPMLLISPFSGVWADRLNKRYLIAASDGLAAVSTVALMAALFAGYDDLWVILTAMALRAVGQAVQTPAVGAILPEIVPEHALMKINGYNGSLQAAIGVLSPVLAGALLTVLPMKWVLAIDVVTAAAAIVFMLALVRVPHLPHVSDEPTTALRDIVDGVKYVVTHRFVGRLNWYFAVTSFLIAPVVFLTPLQVTRSFSNEVWRLTVIEMAFFVGMILGGIVIGKWGGFKRKSASVATAIFVFGIISALLGIPQSFVTYNLLMFVFGLVVPMESAPFTTLVQTSVEPRYLGRVMSLIAVVQSGTMPVAMLLFGPLADQVAIEYILLVAGLLLAVGGLLMLIDRVIRDGEAEAVAAQAAAAAASEPTGN